MKKQGSNAQKLVKIDLGLLNNYEIDKHSINKYKIMQILTTPVEERTIEYLAELQTYLLKISNLPKKFFIEHIDEQSYKKIIDLSLTSCEYKKIRNANYKIYDINEEADLFYIILDGKVKLEKLKILQKEMTGKNYYKILINYKKNNENYLLKKTIEDNYFTFAVDLEDMENIEKFLIKLNLIKFDEDKDFSDYNKSPDFLEEMVNNCGTTLSSFGLESYKDFLMKKNEDILKENSKLIKENKSWLCQKIIEYSIYNARNHAYNNQKILKEKLKNIPKDLCKKYSFFLSESYENITYYELGEAVEKSTNDYFGDISNGKYIQRAYCLSDNLELLCMKNEIYKKFIKNEKARIIESQVGFLLNNFFFQRINKDHFTKIYFPLFETVSYPMNHFIVKENEKVEYVYFIKSGVVKLTSHRSILETYIVIELIKNIFQNSEDKENLRAINNKKYYFKSNLDYLGKEINTRHIKHLITYQYNHCIGFECFYYGLNYLYSAMAVSKEVKVYRIKIGHLIEILKDKGEKSMNDLRKQAEEKINALLERFNLINNELMIYYDKKIANKNAIKLKLKKQKELAASKYNSDKNFGQEEKKKDGKLLLVNNIFIKKIHIKKPYFRCEQKNSKNNKINNNNKVKKEILYSQFTDKLNVESEKKIKNNAKKINYLLNSNFNDIKSLEKKISKKLHEHNSSSFGFDFKKYKMEKLLQSNKTLDSFSPIAKNYSEINFHSILSSSKCKRIMNNIDIKRKIQQNIRKKIISKIFDVKIYKDLSTPNYINRPFKYDFKKSYNTNRKLFLNSIFDYSTSTKKAPSTTNTLENELNVTNNYYFK